jgi:hypothetical protein
VRGGVPRPAETSDIRVCSSDRYGNIAVDESATDIAVCVSLQLLVCGRKRCTESLSLDQPLLALHCR